MVAPSQAQPRTVSPSPPAQVNLVIKALQSEAAELRGTVARQEADLVAAQAVAAGVEAVNARHEAMRKELLKAEVRLVDTTRKYEDTDLENTRLRLIVAALKVGAGFVHACVLL